jgi:hypothetical protein
MRDNSGITYGLLAGMAVVGYFLLFYFIDAQWMLSAGVTWSSLLIYLLFMVFACRKDVAEKEEPSFRVFLRSAFTVFVIANASYYLFYYLMFNVFDPSLADVQRDMLEASLARNENILTPAIKKTIEEQIQGDDFGVSFKDTFFGFAWGLIGGFILAAIVAAIFDRRKTVNLPTG